VREQLRHELRRVALGSGATLVVSRTTPADVDRLASLFEALPFDDRYMRFFSAFRPDTEFVDRLAGANESGACELIALAVDADGREQVVGEAGAWPLANGNGELAITVAPNRRGWLGPYLLDALLDASAEVGMPNLEAEVLNANRRMLALLRVRGFAVAGHDGYNSSRIVISTTNDTPSWPPRDDRPRVLVEVRGGRWNAEEAARGSGLQVVACPGPSSRPARSPCPVLAGRSCPLAAGADVVVVHLPSDDAKAALVAAHAAVHVGVPVCVQTPDDNRHTVALVERVEAMARADTSRAGTT